MIPRRWSIYVIRSRGGALYTGVTTDLDRRLAQHAGRRGGGAKALRGRGPLCIVLARVVGARALALRVEARLKRLPAARKRALVAEPAGLEPILAAARRRGPRRRAAVNACGASRSISSRRGSSRR